MHILCIKSENTENLSLILKYCDNKVFNITDKNGRIPLHYFLANKKLTKDENLFKQFLSFHEEIYLNIKENKGRIPLQIYLSQKKIRLPFLQFLISSKSRVDSCDHFSENSLHYFCKRKDLSYPIAQLLFGIFFFFSNFLK